MDYEPLYLALAMFKLAYTPLTGPKGELLLLLDDRLLLRRIDMIDYGLWEEVSFSPSCLSRREATGNLVFSVNTS